MKTRLIRLGVALCAAAMLWIGGAMSGDDTTVPTVRPSWPDGDPHVVYPVYAEQSDGSFALRKLAFRAVDIASGHELAVAMLDTLRRGLR